MKAATFARPCTIIMAITSSSEFRLRRTRYPREAISKTKIMIVRKKNLDIVLIGNEQFDQTGKLDMGK